jgi:hypothetical protein
MITPFKLMWDLYESMNFPNVSLEESMQASKGKAILHNACQWLLGGSETQLLRLNKVCINYPSTIDDDEVNQID